MLYSLLKLRTCNLHTVIHTILTCFQLSRPIRWRLTGLSKVGEPKKCCKPIRIFWFSRPYLPLTLMPGCIGYAYTYSSQLSCWSSFSDPPHRAMARNTPKLLRIAPLLFCFVSINHTLCVPYEIRYSITIGRFRVFLYNYRTNC